MINKLEIMDKILEVICYFTAMAGIIATYKYNLNEIFYFVISFMFVVFMITMRSLPEEEI